MAQLGRFTHTAASSVTGLPASGASVTIYREGATVNGANSGTSPLTVTVYDIGKIKAGDTVFVNTTTGTTYNVNSTSGRTSIVLGGFAGTLSISGNDRLIPVGSKPTLYADDQASVSTSNPLSTSSTGLASCFIEFGAYDYIVSGGGLTTTLFQGMVSGSEAPGQIRYADDFAASSSTGGIQEAIDDLPTAGGQVRLSGKDYSISDAIWMHSNVHLKGSGMGCTSITRATGSYTDVSAAGSGAVINCGPKGSNGTTFGSGSTGSNITISDLTLDGNYSNFTSITVFTTTPSCIVAYFVDGLNILNVRLQNQLQDGVSTVECKNVHISDTHIDTVGQASPTTSRNGISLLNNNNLASGFSQRFSLNNITMSTIGDMAISLLGVSDVSISNVNVNVCDSFIEFQNSANTAASSGKVTISNSSARGLLADAINFSLPTASKNWDSIIISGCTFEGNSTTHNSGMISRVDTVGVATSNVIIRGCTFTNINTTDTTARSWINLQGQHANSSITNWTLVDCVFVGKTGSVRTNDSGLVLKGVSSNCRFRNVLIQTIAGTGVVLGTPAAITSVSRNVRLDDVVVDTATNTPFIIGVSNANTTVKEYTFANCTARNGNVGTDSKAFVLQQTAVGTVSKINFINCRTINDAATGMITGLRLDNSGAGTMDEILVQDCDFDGMTNDYTQAGTVTNFRAVGHKMGAVQAIAAVGNSITLPSKIKNCTIFLTADANYELTSTPTIADGGFEGQRLYIMNVDTGADIITLRDEATGAGCNLLNAGSGNWAMNPGDNIVYQWSSALSAWVQIGGENTIA